jgi:hypothetical protein
MKACIVVNPKAQHQILWGTAFRDGLVRHGWKAEVSPVAAAACDLLVMWSVRRHDYIRLQKERRGEVCILERGYLGDRTAWTSVSFGGGLNGHGEFRGRHDDSSRFEEHFGTLLKPWHKTGIGWVLILGQVTTDMSLRGLQPLKLWEAAAAHYAAAGRYVAFRPHPLSKAGGYVRGAKTLDHRAPLVDALANTALAITINSNSGVDAVLAGVPTIALDDRSMAWAVTSHEVAASPITPDRAAWATRLAWCQWNEAEIASGDCWAHVGGRLR